MEQALVKPQPTAEGHYLYSEVIRYLEARYGFRSEDSSESDGHFEKWADARGYTEHKLDPQGNHRRSSTVWYDEYNDDPEGAARRPAARSLRNWICWAQNAFMEYRIPDKPFTLNLGMMVDWGDWDNTVAPVMDMALELTRERAHARISELLEREDVPLNYRERLLREPLRGIPENARIPEFARPVLERMHEEFGARVQLSFQG
jgi:hypothetical protein